MCARVLVTITYYVDRETRGMDKLKVGVVGCGFVAKKDHVPSFLRLKRDVVISAVCDLNQSLATSVAKKFSIPDAYSNISEMLKKEDLDILDICTPPQVHAPLAIEAMEKNCHVLLEKPMALKTSDCDQMINIAQKNSLKLCVVHNEIFRPPLLKARELLEKDDIGKLTGMRWTRFTHKEEYMSLKNHWVHKLPGGILGETGPHSVYTSLAFLKKIKNVEISAKKTLEYPWVSYDYFNMLLEGEKANSSIIISHSNDNFIADVELYGTKGCLKMDLQSMILTRYKLKETKLVPIALSTLSTVSQMMKSMLFNTTKVMFIRHSLARALGFATLIEQYVNSIIYDQKTPVSAEEGRETVKVMENIVKKLHDNYGNPK